MTIRPAISLALAAPLLALAAVTSPAAAPLTLRYRGLESRESRGAVFVMPGETLAVAISVGAARLEASAGSVSSPAPMLWRWVAPPAPGTYTLRATSTGGADTVVLSAFVMVPASAVRNGWLHGYHIGRYPAVPLHGLAVYRAPRGFVEVTPANEDVYLTPHLQLRQFVTKQGGAFPRYLVLDERLLAKLETLLDALHQAGYAVSRFRVMSGYRTPYYNHAIGNVEYSRHIYGAAADILVDDLNGDGVIDRRDADLFAAVVERRFGARGDPELIGGLGEYSRTAAHGPFVHVDVRGFQARW